MEDRHHDAFFAVAGLLVALLGMGEGDLEAAMVAAALRSDNSNSVALLAAIALAYVTSNGFVPFGLFEDALFLRPQAELAGAVLFKRELSAPVATHYSNRGRGIQCSSRCPFKLGTTQDLLVWIATNAYSMITRQWSAESSRAVEAGFAAV